ncbi:MAG: thymidylate synthase [Acidobacteriota bacterium]
MHFEPLYYADRLKIVNPAGDVGITTLWSKVESAVTILEEAGVDLNPESSRISVIANLYGNGLPQMLRNLLWNPQIRHIVIVGKNLSGSREWLLNFFAHGLEEVDFLGAKAFRIRNTTRTLDGCVLPQHFPRPIQFHVLGDLGDVATKSGFAELFRGLPAFEPCDTARIEPPPIPEPAVTRYPSEPRGQSIIRDTPMQAWSELIFRLYRFGHRNIVAKKTGPEGRVELQNIKVVIENPVEESDETLREFGFTLEKFQGYQQRILEAVKPPDLGYTYGNRLRGYFQHDGVTVDSLEIAAQRLKEKPDSRHAYITLWDNSRDLPEGTDTPCFVTAFFRKFEDRLTLTATFRSHNALDAWPENVYGLIAIQKFVADRADIKAGALTVISHSISIDLPSLARAKRVADGKESDEVIDASGKLGPRMDPNGAFTTTFDRATWELVVEHSFDGMKIGEYRGKSAEEIERKLARDVALSEIAHALYLGREIARKEFEMKAERAKENRKGNDGA